MQQFWVCRVASDGQKMIIDGYTVFAIRLKLVAAGLNSTSRNS